jgi:hypothetical protein
MVFSRKAENNDLPKGCRKSNDLFQGALRTAGFINNIKNTGAFYRRRLRANVGFLRKSVMITKLSYMDRIGSRLVYNSVFVVDAA